MRPKGWTPKSQLNAAADGFDTTAAAVAVAETPCPELSMPHRRHASCLSLPRPEPEGAVRHQDVASSFAKKIDGMRKQLGDVLSEPHRFGGQPVHGGVFPLLLKEVCDSINEGVQGIAPVRCAALL